MMKLWTDWARKNEAAFPDCLNMQELLNQRDTKK
jgi:hypothetical protein